MHKKVYKKFISQLVSRTSKIPYYADLPQSTRLLVFVSVVVIIFIIFGIVAVNYSKSPKSTTVENNKASIVEKTTTTPSVEPSIKVNKIPTDTSVPTKYQVSISPQITQSSSNSGTGDISVNYVNSEGAVLYPPNQIATLKNMTTGEIKTFTNTPSFFAGQLAVGKYQISVNTRADYKIHYSIGQNSSYVEGSSVNIDLKRTDIISVTFKYTSINSASSDTGSPEVQSFSGPNDNSVISNSDICISVTATDNITPQDKLQLTAYLGKGEKMGSSNTNVATRENVAGLSHCFNGLTNGFYVLRYFVKDEAGNSSTNRLVAFEILK